jgi:hypothetical protein
VADNVATPPETGGGWGKSVITIVLTATLTLMITYLGTRLFDSWFADEKVLEVSAPAAQNLAAIPNAEIAARLRITYDIGAGMPQVVQSLFGYRVTVRNKSAKERAENISLYILPPEKSTLVESPQITTTPANMQKIITNKITPHQNGVLIVVGYLDPGNSITYAYTATSLQPIEGPTRPDVIVNEKGWTTVRSDTIESNPAPKLNSELNLNSLLFFTLSITFTMMMMVAVFLFYMFIRSNRRSPFG